MLAAAVIVVVSLNKNFTHVAPTTYIIGELALAGEANINWLYFS